MTHSDPSTADKMECGISDGEQYDDQFGLDEIVEDIDQTHRPNYLEILWDKETNERITKKNGRIIHVTKFDDDPGVEIDRAEYLRGDR